MDQDYFTGYQDGIEEVKEARVFLSHASRSKHNEVYYKLRKKGYSYFDAHRLAAKVIRNKATLKKL
jgi:hypothetical protein